MEGRDERPRLFVRDGVEIVDILHFAGVAVAEVGHEAVDVRGDDVLGVLLAVALQAQHFGDFVRLVALWADPVIAEAHHVAIGQRVRRFDPHVAQPALPKPPRRFQLD